MQSTCSLDDKPHNIRRRQRSAEIRLQRDLVLKRKIDSNRKKYPELFKIIDSKKFKNWWIISTGKPWDQKLEANVEDMVVKLNAMQMVYGEIPG